MSSLIKSYIADALIDFVRGATLVIHNAPFDLSFLDMEVEKSGLTLEFRDICGVIDTLALARARHPMQRNNLDALCRRYGIDTSARAKGHGALIDAGLLADLYLIMTTGQSSMALDSDPEKSVRRSSLLDKLLSAREEPLRVIRANPSEVEHHEERMREIHKKHVKTLEQKVKDLDAKIKQLAEKIAIEKDLIKREKLRDELRESQSDLSTAEAALPLIRLEGPRYF